MMINIIYACKYTYAYDLYVYIYIYMYIRYKYIYIYRHISLVLQASMKQTSYQLLLLGLHVFFPRVAAVFSQEAEIASRASEVA